MDRKLKNTLVLIIILILLIAAGGVYSFVIQKGKIKDRDKKIKELKVKAENPEVLMKQLESVKKQAAELDSILALRKFNIPNNLPQTRFFDFVNKVSRNFTPFTHIDINYENLINDKNFHNYLYKLSGKASFNDLYKLIYAIEKSKELKKIKSVNMNNIVEVDKDGIPHYLVSFTMKVSVYFSDNDRFATSKIKENRLTANPIYNVFYPLIRKEIPPNTEHLLDVQSAELLALIPDGAYLADAQGNAYLLWEGDKVYLGYLTKIDYDKNEVRFILNKGGIIEKVTLTLDKEKENEQKSKSDKK